MVPHRGTNWAALWLTAQIGRDAVLSESYGRGYTLGYNEDHIKLRWSHAARKIKAVRLANFVKKELKLLVDCPLCF